MLVCYPDSSTEPTYALSPSYLATLPPLTEPFSDSDEDFVGHIFMHTHEEAFPSVPLSTTAATSSAATDVVRAVETDAVALDRRREEAAREASVFADDINKIMFKHP